MFGAMIVGAGVNLAKNVAKNIKTRNKIRKRFEEFEGDEEEDEDIDNEEGNEEEENGENHEGEDITQQIEEITPTDTTENSANDLSSQLSAVPTSQGTIDLNVNNANEFFPNIPMDLTSQGTIDLNVNNANEFFPNILMDLTSQGTIDLNVNNANEFFPNIPMDLTSQGTVNVEQPNNPEKPLPSYGPSNFIETPLNGVTYNRVEENQFPQKNVVALAHDQSIGPTLQDLNDIEKEIINIEKKITNINNDIESGTINAAEGAAKVKALMAEAKMKEKRLERVRQQVMHQQGAMPLGQNMLQAQPGMMYAPQSPQGMPLFAPPLGQMVQPMPGQEIYYAQQPPGMAVPPQQMWGEGANEITEGEGEEEKWTSKDKSKKGSGKSSENDVEEANSPYSNTHKAIFYGNEVERRIAETEELKGFCIDTLFEEMEKHFFKYLFGDESEPKEKEKKKTAAHKPYDKIIEELFANIDNCYENYKSSIDLYDPNYLFYKKALCECIQDWDSDIVKAFIEISNIKKSAAVKPEEKSEEEPESIKRYEEARKLIANLENVIQANAYIGFYNKSVKELFGNKNKLDDDDVWSSKRKLIKDDSEEKHSIAECYVATARTIKNLIEVINFIRGGEAQKDGDVVGKVQGNSADVVKRAEDLCGECTDLNTPLGTSVNNFKKMHPIIKEDINAKKSEIFGSKTNEVNDQMFSQSLETLTKLIEKLNNANYKKEEKISIEGELTIINDYFCKIPNKLGYKLQDTKNIMTGIFTEDEYDSHKKMFK